jgi:D-aminoacyl-tRNA deacylase
MIALIQRVIHASVTIDGAEIATIGRGIVALIGVCREDNESSADRLLTRLIGYRIFADETGRMNLNLQQTDGDLLLVPQFTLAADTHKGMRAGFSPAAAPDEGKRLFDYLLQQAMACWPKIASGRFGANMAVTLTNDGPVTFWLQSH